MERSSLDFWSQLITRHAGPKTGQNNGEQCVKKST
jgi:hypothetical protein